MKLFLFVLLFPVFGFSRVMTKDIPPAIAAQYRPYAVEFINLSDELLTTDNIALLSIKETKLEYSEKNYGTVGLCTWGTHSDNNIDIDPKWWKTASNIRRRALIFHEMGHCVCNMDHPVIEKNWFTDWLDRHNIRNVRSDNVYFRDNCPKSLMYYQVVEESCLRRHKDWYDKELFKSCQPNAMFGLAPTQ